MLLAGLSGDGLIARPSFFQLENTRKARDRGEPWHLIVHEHVLIFRRGAAMYRTLYENMENFLRCEVAMTTEERLIIKEHFGRSIVVGLLAAILAAIAWVLLEYWNGRVYELLPIPLGCFVGIAVGRVAHSPRLRILMTGAIITVFGCVLGPILLLILLELKAHHSFHYIFSHLGVLIRSFPHFVGLIGFLMWPLGVACAVGGAVAGAFIYISSQLSSDSVKMLDDGTMKDE